LVAGTQSKNGLGDGGKTKEQKSQKISVPEDLHKSGRQNLGMSGNGFFKRRSCNPQERAGANAGEGQAVGLLQQRRWIQPGKEKKKNAKVSSLDGRGASGKVPQTQ